MPLIFSRSSNSLTRPKRRSFWCYKNATHDVCLSAVWLVALAVALRTRKIPCLGEAVRRMGEDGGVGA